MVTNFDELLLQLKEQGTRKRIAVVCPSDESTLWALDRARRTGLADIIPVDDDDKAVAARRAVALVRAGKADVLMKGFVNTDVLLRAVLDKETGILAPGRVLTHIAATRIPSYPKMLFFTDAAVIPYPTAAQRVEQVRYTVALCHRLGIAMPRVSLIHCSEKVDSRHFPFTADYLHLKEQALQGAFGRCIVDGPLDLKTSCDAHAMQVKGIQSPIKGQADALIFPDIEAANLFYKTITLFCGATTAGILQGTRVPVVLASRGDDPSAKLYSMALASAAGE